MSLSISANAVQSAVERFTRAAEQVARGPVAPDFPADVVAIKTARLEVESAVQVLETENELLGYLVDTLA